MPNYTPNYRLIKPTDNEYFDIANDNSNMDIIDSEIKKINSHLNDIAYDRNFDDDFIFMPTFETDNPNTNDKWNESLYMSKNGLDFYKICDYAKPSQFTDYPTACDVSTIYKDGYFYQIYDYMKYSHPQYIIDSGLFLGGNGIQIRKTKDFKTYEFIDIELDRKWLQVWAPEFYIEDNNIHILLSLSDCTQTIVTNEDRGKTTEYVKHTYIISSTDFVNWSTPKLIDLSLKSEIDPFVIKQNNYYYLFISDQYNGKIKQYKSSNLIGDYTLLNEIDTDEKSYSEAPAIIKYNNGFYLYVDVPTVGLKVYYTDNIEKFYNNVMINQNAKPLAKHCTPIVIDNKDLKNIIQNISISNGKQTFDISCSEHHRCNINHYMDRLVLYPNTTYNISYASFNDITFNSYIVNLMNIGETCKIFNNTNGKSITLLTDSVNGVSVNAILSKSKKTNNKIVELTCIREGVIVSNYSTEERNYGDTILIDCNNPTELLSVFNSSTLNSPYKFGLCTGQSGFIISNRETANWNVQMALIQGEPRMFIRASDGNGWGDWYSNSLVTTSANRPTRLRIGSHCFDTTLGKPIWYNGTEWIDATGSIV